MKRRRFLLTTTAIGVGLLAGCTGGGGGDTGDGGADNTSPPTPTASRSPTRTPTKAMTATPETLGQREYPDYNWSLLGDATPTATARIAARDYKWQPLIAEVPVGSPITFTNEDAYGHTLAIPGLDVKRKISPGSSVQVTITQAGTYDYVCTVHPPTMLGRLIASTDVSVATDTPTPTPTPVSTPAGVDAVVDMVNTAFSPRKLSVEPGATVLWRNRDSFAHTVTSAQFHDVAASWEFDSGDVSAGGTITHTFDSKGVYEYYCTIHGEGTMCGAVLVGDVSLEEDLPCAGGGGYY